MAYVDPETSATGYEALETSVSCVLTRFRVRSARSLVHLHRSFRKVRDEARDVPGLLTSLFLFEDLRTCYTLSFWRDEQSIIEFNSNVRAHIEAANSCFRHLRLGAVGLELWSAQLHLSAVSRHNLRWDAMSLQTILDARNFTVTRRRQGTNPGARENRDVA